MSEKRLWSPSETLQLIEKYENVRELWDASMGRNSAYLKKIKRRTLQELAAEFDTTDLEVARKLHNLKTQFSQELKKVYQNTTSSGKQYESKWQYFHMLRFLEPTVKLNTSSVIDDSMFQNSTNSSIEAIKEELLVNTPSIKRNKKCTPQKKFNTTLNGDSDHSLPRTPDKNDDEYKIFGDYVANEIRNMHFIRYKGLLKRKIQKLIIEFTELDEEEYLKRENGVSESVYIAKPGPSQVKDEELSESMYLVMNDARHVLDNSPSRQDDPLGKV